MADAKQGVAWGIIIVLCLGLAIVEASAVSYTKCTVSRPVVTHVKDYNSAEIQKATCYFYGTNTWQDIDEAQIQVNSVSSPLCTAPLQAGCGGRFFFDTEYLNMGEIESWDAPYPQGAEYKMYDDGVNCAGNSCVVTFAWAYPRSSSSSNPWTSNDNDISMNVKPVGGDWIGWSIPSENFDLFDVVSTTTIGDQNPPTVGTCTVSNANLKTGTGYQTQTATCTYSDSDGYTDLENMWIRINYDETPQCLDWDWGKAILDSDCGGAVLRSCYFDVGGCSSWGWMYGWVPIEAKEPSQSCSGTTCRVSFYFFYPRAWLKTGIDIAMSVKSRRLSAPSPWVIPASNRNLFSTYTNDELEGPCSVTQTELVTGSGYETQELVCTYYNGNGFADIKTTSAGVNYPSDSGVTPGPLCFGMFAWTRATNTFKDSYSTITGSQYARLDVGASYAQCSGKTCTVHYVFRYPEVCEDPHINIGKDASWVSKTYNLGWNINEGDVAKFSTIRNAPDGDSSQQVCEAGGWIWAGSKCCGDDGAADDYCEGLGVCSDGVWTANHCANGKQDCDEANTDCGGAQCSACVTCAQACGAKASLCSNMQNSFSCSGGDCQFNYVEKSGTTCTDRCWCFEKAACGTDFAECSEYCTASGCVPECITCSDCGGGTDCKEFGACGSFTGFCDAIGVWGVTTYSCSETDGDGINECASLPSSEACTRVTNGLKCNTTACPQDTCAGAVLNDYPLNCSNLCSSGSCNACTCTPTPRQCSLAGNWDVDAIACNCDCSGFDVSENSSNGNCEDGVDNDCDGLIDYNDAACKKEARVSCIEDLQCKSGYCDNDNLGADIDPYNDDGWCFNPEQVNKEDQDHACEVSTELGDSGCDELSSSTDCSFTDGRHFWCNSSCEQENRDKTPAACTAWGAFCSGGFSWLKAGETNVNFVNGGWEYSDKRTLGCCGDDSKENPRNRNSSCTEIGCTLNDQPSIGDSILDRVCCNSTLDCVFEGNCYTSGNKGGAPQTFGGDNPATPSVFCENGVWYDCDNSKGGCEELNGRCGFSKGWVLQGESGVGEYDIITKSECCGDDANEFLINSSGFQGHASGDVRCCNSSFDCVLNGGCGKGSSNGGKEMDCYDGIDNDCDSATDFCDGRYQLPCARYDGLDRDCMANISGQVKDYLGLGLGHAEVIVLTYFEYKGFSRVINFTTRADENGNYNLEVYGGSNYEIVARLPGYHMFASVSKQVETGGEWAKNITLEKDVECEEDCTKKYDEACHKDCDGVNGCRFFDPVAAAACDLQPKLSIEAYNFTNVLECCEGAPRKELSTAQAEVSVPNSTTVFRTTRLVIYRGKPINMIVVTFG